MYNGHVIDRVSGAGARKPDTVDIVPQTPKTTLKEKVMKTVHRVLVALYAETSQYRALFGDGTQDVEVFPVWGMSFADRVLLGLILIPQRPF